MHSKTVKYNAVEHFVADTTPPVLTMTSTPTPVIKDQYVLFSWTCPLPCTTKCTVHVLNGSFPAEHCLGTGYQWSIPSSTASNVTFTLEVKATDDVGNTISLVHKWTTGILIL